jgi:hypothetical protein
MCGSCLEIDKRIEQYRQLLSLTLQASDRAHINELIPRLYLDRVWLHTNPHAEIGVEDENDNYREQASDAQV